MSCVELRGGSVSEGDDAFSSGSWCSSDSGDSDTECAIARTSGIAHYDANTAALAGVVLTGVYLNGGVVGADAEEGKHVTDDLKMDPNVFRRNVVVENGLEGGRETSVFEPMDTTRTCVLKWDWREFQNMDNVLRAKAGEKGVYRGLKTVKRANGEEYEKEAVPNGKGYGNGEWFDKLSDADKKAVDVLITVMNANQVKENQEQFYTVLGEEYPEIRETVDQINEENAERIFEDSKGFFEEWGVPTISSWFSFDVVGMLQTMLEKGWDLAMEQSKVAGEALLKYLLDLAGTFFTGPLSGLLGPVKGFLMFCWTHAGTIVYVGFNAIKYAFLFQVLVFLYQWCGPFLTMFRKALALSIWIGQKTFFPLAKQSYDIVKRSVEFLQRVRNDRKRMSEAGSVPEPEAPHVSALNDIKNGGHKTGVTKLKVLGKQLRKVQTLDGYVGWGVDVFVHNFSDSLHEIMRWNDKQKAFIAATAMLTVWAGTSILLEFVGKEVIIEVCIWFGRGFFAKYSPHANLGHLQMVAWAFQVVASVMGDGPLKTMLGSVGSIMKLGHSGVHNGLYAMGSAWMWVVYGKPKNSSIFSALRPEDGLKQLAGLRHKQNSANWASSFLKSAGSSVLKSVHPFMVLKVLWKTGGWSVWVFRKLYNV